MATDPPTKPRRPRAPKTTWRDWMAPEDPEPAVLITRDELLEELNARGLDVDSYDIENWQRIGVIPYGVRRSHGGVVKNLYPRWVLAAIGRLRDLQRAGYKLQQIAPRLRGRVPDLIAEQEAVDTAVDAARREAHKLWEEARHHATNKLAPTAAQPESWGPMSWSGYVEDVAEMMQGIIRRHESEMHGTVVRAEVMLDRNPDGSTGRVVVRLHTTYDETDPIPFHYEAIPDQVG